MGFGKRNRHREISVVQAAAQHEAGVAILDVRGPEEWAAGHIVDARHVPLDELSADRLSADEPVLVICRSGTRSARGAQILIAAGLDARSVTGGMAAWSAAGFEMRSDTGQPPVVA